MNEETKIFIDELKARPDVLGVILFGSWARGNNRPDSDVDLVVILTEGYRRTVEHRNGQVFEIIFITERGALDYWESHKDDAVGLWEVAKILYDKNGAILRLREKIKTVLDAGKKPIDEFQIGQFRFDAEDQLRVSEILQNRDSTTANLILSNKVFALTELFFDLRQMWIPAPKQRLANIKETKPELYLELENFYKDGALFGDRLQIAERIVELVFET